MNIHSAGAFNPLLITLLFIFIIQLVTKEANAQYGLEIEDDTLTQSVLIHPPVAEPEGRGSVLFTREHTYSQSYAIGDQLARDFIVMQIGPDGIMRPFKPGSEGRENEDWYTWRKDVLAPFNGTVTLVQHPDSTNIPGHLSEEAQNGQIHFKDEEGVVVSYGHLREIEVQEGQQVKAGVVVAKAGNNGSSIAPHVHVAAWKDDTPLQIHVDLYAKERFKKTSDK